MDSMTGYGNAEGQIDDTSYLVEIKSVNNRYFKGNIKLPEPLAFLESDIEQFLRKNLHRGSVNYTLRFKNNSASIAWNIDELLLKKAAEKLISAAPLTEGRYNIDIATLLTLRFETGNAGRRTIGKIQKCRSTGYPTRDGQPKKDACPGGLSAGRGFRGEL